MRAGVPVDTRTSGIRRCFRIKNILCFILPFFFQVFAYFQIMYKGGKEEDDVSKNNYYTIFAVRAYATCAKNYMKYEMYNQFAPRLILIYNMFYAS